MLYLWSHSNIILLGGTEPRRDRSWNWNVGRKSSWKWRRWRWLQSHSWYAQVVPLATGWYSDNVIFSDAEIDDEDEIETNPEVNQVGGKHKRTGAPLTELKMNGDEIKIPPADSVKVETPDQMEE